MHNFLLILIKFSVFLPKMLAAMLLTMTPSARLDRIGTQWILIRFIVQAHSWNGESTHMSYMLFKNNKTVDTKGVKSNFTFHAFCSFIYLSKAGLVK